MAMVKENITYGKRRSWDNMLIGKMSVMFGLGAVVL
jgi:hypothetical protein